MWLMKALKNKRWKNIKIFSNYFGRDIIIFRRCSRIHVFNFFINILKGNIRKQKNINYLLLKYLDVYDVLK